ncbi:hypothetical protein Bca4012_039810 [Brassica carinata]
MHVQMNNEQSLRKYLVKVLAALLVVFFAPFLAPPLVVATTIAFISSLPYCFFLASYVCTEKLMRKLLPDSAFGGRDEKTVPLRDKFGIYDDGMARVAMSEPINFFDVYESHEEMRKESKSLLDSIRDEDRTNQSLDRRISAKDFREDNREWITDKSENVGVGTEDLSRKKNVSGTTHEEALDSITKETSRGEDMEESSNEMKVLYSEEQIWEKMETLRKIVGYSVARNTRYSEELKALYMFTGVELRTSLLENENQDIAQVSERLYSLMSVIGIK